MTHKIHTKTGDNGTTTLVGGQRISKADTLIETYGNCDELNAFIGMAMAEIAESDGRENEKKDVLATLTDIQNTLFDVGSLLATLPDDWKHYFIDTEDIITQKTIALEEKIDRMAADLPSLRQFILPNGSKIIAALHVCRTVCRRTERSIAVLAAHDDRYLSPLRYVNRLSDFFYILAMIYHQKENITPTFYQSAK